MKKKKKKSADSVHRRTGEKYSRRRGRAGGDERVDAERRWLVGDRIPVSFCAGVEDGVNPNPQTS